jgi:hypothetical protein
MNNLCFKNSSWAGIIALNTTGGRVAMFKESPNMLSLYQEQGHEDEAQALLAEASGWAPEIFEHPGA